MRLEVPCTYKLTSISSLSIYVLGLIGQGGSKKEADLRQVGKFLCGFLSGNKPGGLGSLSVKALRAFLSSEEKKTGVESAASHIMRKREREMIWEG